MLPELLTNQNLQQILLIIVTVYFTQACVNYFINRRQKWTLIHTSISSIKQVKYKLGAAAYHRYEAEIFSNYYEMLSNYPDINQANIDLIKSLPVLSQEMYSLYSEIFYHLSVIEQNIDKKNWEKIEEYVQAIYNYNLIDIKHPKELTNVNLENYKKETADHIKLILKKEIDGKIDLFIEKLISIL